MTWWKNPRQLHWHVMLLLQAVENPSLKDIVAAAAQRYRLQAECFQHNRKNQKESEHSLNLNVTFKSSLEYQNVETRR